jgi:uncharacterized protein (DUF433 family)
MSQPIKPVPGYQWIVQDPELLGGKPAVKDTRLSVSHVLACLAEGMDADEISETYGEFPKEAIAEVLRFASEALDKPNVAA